MRCARCETSTAVITFDGGVGVCAECAVRLAAPEVGEPMGARKAKVREQLNAWFDGREHGYRAGIRFGVAAGIAAAILAYAIIHELGGM